MNQYENMSGLNSLQNPLPELASLPAAAKSLQYSPELTALGSENAQQGTGLNAIASPSEQSAWGKAWDYLTKGGGSSNLTDQELRRLNSLNNGITNENDPELRNQLLSQRAELMQGTQDRGGLFGSLGRAATGQGQTTGENVLTGIGALAMPLIKMYLNKMAAEQASRSVANQYGQNFNNMRSQAADVLNRG